MGVDIIGILLQRLLRQRDGVAAAIERQVKVRQLLVSVASLGVRLQSVLEILDRFQRLLLVAFGLRHQGVQSPHRKVVISGGASAIRRRCGALVRCGRGLRQRNRYEGAHKGKRFD